jgi:hypothetical protein
MRAACQFTVRFIHLVNKRLGPIIVMLPLIFAPIELGKIGEGGLLVQARGRTWGQLIFQDLARFG